MSTHLSASPHVPSGDPLSPASHRKPPEPLPARRCELNVQQLAKIQVAGGWQPGGPKATWTWGLLLRLIILWW